MPEHFNQLLDQLVNPHFLNKWLSLNTKYEKYKKESDRWKRKRRKGSNFSKIGHLYMLQGSFHFKFSFSILCCTLKMHLYWCNFNSDRVVHILISDAISSISIIFHVLMSTFVNMWLHHSSIFTCDLSLGITHWCNENRQWTTSFTVVGAWHFLFFFNVMSLFCVLLIYIH